MVINHSQKKRIRRAMDSRPALSYREAARWLQAIDAHNFRLSGADLDVAREAAGIIDSTQRDLIVFGTANSGKSVALREILTASTIDTRLLLEDEKGWLGNPSGSFNRHGLAIERGPERIAMRLNSLPMPGILGYDELIQPPVELEDYLKKVPRRAFAVHAHRPDLAIERVEDILPSLALRDPLLVSSLWGHTLKPLTERELTIHRS